MLVDADVNTKWLDFGCCDSTLTFAFVTASLIHAYDLTTANDFADRDPTAWTLECERSNDGTFVLRGRTSKARLVTAAPL